MTDRLRELQRQRSLVQEQLAWLDREIAAAHDHAAVPPAQGPASTPVVAPANAPTVDPTDAIIAEYQKDSAALPGKVRRGCFLYFFLALALVGIGVLVLYLNTTRK